MFYKISDDKIINLNFCQEITKSADNILNFYMVGDVGGFQHQEFSSKNERNKAFMDIFFDAK